MLSDRFIADRNKVHLEEALGALLCGRPLALLRRQLVWSKGGKVKILNNFMVITKNRKKERLFNLHDGKGCARAQ